VAAALIRSRAAAPWPALIHLASSERRAEEIGRALRQMAPDLEVLVLPPWDCLPYDRASPSREVMGRRMAVLQRLAAKPEGPRVLVTGVEAALQRVPPKAVTARAALDLEVGAVLDREALRAFALSTGYVFDDRIDEPGEIAILGEVVDVFPAASEAPVRLSLGPGDEILDIRRYDPLTQRTEEPIRCVRVTAASELILDPEAERVPGAEHAAPEVYGEMGPVLDLCGKAWLSEDPKARQRAAELGEQIEEAYAARRSFGEAEGVGLLKPERLYLTPAELEAQLDGRKTIRPELEGVRPIPRFALDRNPGRAFADFVERRLGEGAVVGIAGLPHELRSLARALQRGLGRTPGPPIGWEAFAAADGGALHALELDVDAGFDDGRQVVVCASDVMGGRVAKRGAGGASGQLLEPELRAGDVVIHEDHGVGVLRALERAEVDGTVRDVLRIEYHGGATLLAGTEAFGRIWRYGAEEEAVTLDRLHTDAWSKRRVEISRHIDETAARLVEVAREREAAEGLVLEPPKAAFARFAARFPYPETPDQSAAIAAVLDDLASGRRMNRLVCGDVGFGKTEVALRAAAAAALSGRQVAIVAPTTVLARQHYETFRRRFAPFGLEVAQLSRLVATPEAKAVKAGLADGTVRVVVGTHALAGSGVAFADLGLLIIDEEQRFGARIKQSLQELQADAHLLTLTATPIPRTLQLALVGIQDISVIATPPARRRPIRTFLAPFDAATLRTALLREKRRGGQSFLVTPRIEDIEPMRARLSELVPELSVRIAHGGLDPEAVDEAMVGFADGDGDVLLATNIIESGLDVPRANTMLVWRADRFGLAQLHQLRGRVGRGRAQGIAYLLTDPAEPVSDATRARLSTLEAFDRLGSGLAISARDLDLRGSGDLVGEDQAGHMQMIGAALYQQLLGRAVRVARGEETGPDWTPELKVEATGEIPEAYVPDPTIRINLYWRMARLTEPDEVAAFAEELEDRFGTIPPEAETLLALKRIETAARRAGVRKVGAGPRGVAFTLDRTALKRLKTPPKGAVLREDRLVWSEEEPDAAARLGRVEALLASLPA
jgi:transcription-repair coupling factor (superfamily II helicase)